MLFKWPQCTIPRRTMQNWPVLNGQSEAIFNFRTARDSGVIAKLEGNRPFWADRLQYYNDDRPRPCRQHLTRIEFHMHRLGPCSDCHSYFFSSAGQFTTSVSGADDCCGPWVITTNFFPSALTSYGQWTMELGFTW